MIAGATRGSGGSALSRHLLSCKGGQQVLVMPSRGLAAEDLRGQIAEIVADAAHGRTDRPIHHVHVDPPPDASNPNEIIGVFLRNYEIEFGLRGNQRAGVFHLKSERQHAHVVYSLVGQDSRVADLRHEYARREKVCRVTEFECGHPLIKGRHNRAVEQALRKDGRIDIADAMVTAGLLDGKPGIAHSTPRQRAQAERTDVPIDEIRSTALAAWRASDDARSFAIALHTFGSIVATGEKGLLLVDRSGSVHSLNRLLAAAARAAGEDRITAAAVRKRLSGINFPPLKEAKNVRSRRQNPDGGSGSAADIGASVATSEPVGRGGWAEQSARRIERPAAGNSGDLGAPTENITAHRKRVRDRVATLALSSIDFQSIIKNGRDIMTEFKAQEFKAKLLAGIAPKGFDAHAFAVDLRMIKEPATGKTATRILMTDGGWIEYDPHARSVRTWGSPGRAQVLARALGASIGVEVTHLAKTASIGADAAALKVTKVSEDAVHLLVGWWTARGYSATAAPDGCWINAGRARILDRGDSMEIHGGLTDEAVAATILKAKKAWGGGVYLDGFWTQAEQDHIWLAAMRADVEVQNCSPSILIQQAWDRECEVSAKTARTISAIKTEIADAQRLLEAAQGDVEAAKKLPGSLQAFVGIYLDDDQRRELAAQPIAEIVPNLERFRKLGAVELESYQAPTGKRVAFAEPEKDKAGVGLNNTRAPQ